MKRWNGWFELCAFSSLDGVNLGAWGSTGDLRNGIVSKPGKLRLSARVSLGDERKGCFSTWDLHPPGKQIISSPGNVYMWKNSSRF